jgi:hypothetical protein
LLLGEGDVWVELLLGEGYVWVELLVVEGDVWVGMGESVLNFSWALDT